MTVLSRFICLIVILGVGLLGQTTRAVELAGVTLAPTATLTDGSVLVLNGAGVRKKFFVDVYIGALYLPSPATRPTSS